jgi:hypothetical protein
MDVTKHLKMALKNGCDKTLSDKNDDLNNLHRLFRLLSRYKRQIIKQ